MRIPHAPVEADSTPRPEQLESITNPDRRRDTDLIHVRQTLSTVEICTEGTRRPLA
jgi:hypothetical protein